MADHTVNHKQKKYTEYFGLSVKTYFLKNKMFQNFEIIKYKLYPALIKMKIAYIFFYLDLISFNSFKWVIPVACDPFINW